MLIRLGSMAFIFEMIMIRAKINSEDFNEFRQKNRYFKRTRNFIMTVIIIH